MCFIRSRSAVAFAARSCASTNRASASRHWPIKSSIWARSSSFLLVNNLHVFSAAARESANRARSLSRSESRSSNRCFLVPISPNLESSASASFKLRSISSARFLSSSISPPLFSISISLLRASALCPSTFLSISDSSRPSSTFSLSTFSSSLFIRPISSVNKRISLSFSSSLWFISFVLLSHVAIFPSAFCNFLSNSVSFPFAAVSISPFNRSISPFNARISFSFSSNFSVVSFALLSHVAIFPSAFLNFISVSESTAPLAVSISPFTCASSSVNLQISFSFSSVFSFISFVLLSHVDILPSIFLSFFCASSSFSSAKTTLFSSVPFSFSNPTNLSFISLTSPSFLFNSLSNPTILSLKISPSFSLSTFAINFLPISSTSLFNIFTSSFLSAISPNTTSSNCLISLSISLFSLSNLSLSPSTLAWFLFTLPASLSASKARISASLAPLSESHLPTTSLKAGTICPALPCTVFKISVRSDSALSHLSLASCSSASNSSHKSRAADNLSRIDLISAF
eukprot:comp23539_c1_seq1/m.39675 comp23539_c1_seq1/g.39675  ORF comp23539_c1_seq1/g.39675 comp23539_c1_seq1/m.39675 type:complete len:516 (+) comp23539_c1_seq1:609-2156(+)